jgi:GTP-binding protein SAR1
MNVLEFIMWKNLCTKHFCVDNNNKKKNVQALLTTDVLQGVPFLVLGNKIDLPLAASEPQLRDALGLHDTTGKEVTERVENQRPIEVFMCSVVRKMGYKDG